MSHTSIPTKIQWQIWVQAGGRCEYRGCNVPLWKDELTLAKMNRAYLAHIIADSPGGPRGDPILSEELKSEPSNIMLLCDTHHRLIDKIAVDEHPVALLRIYKREHEERIEQLTSLQANLRTEILLFGTRIGERRGEVNYQDACLTVLPNRYPSSEKGISIDLADVNMNELDPGFWDLVQIHIDRELDRYLGDSKGPSGKPINHLSIFALAPIPALIYLGKKLGDIRSADVYQRHRQPVGWRWRDLEDEDFKYLFEYSGPEQNNIGSPVTINLSFSNPVRNRDIEEFFGEKPHIYTLSIPHPNRNFLRSIEQLELFLNVWYKLMSSIQQAHGSNCDVHLFAAVPNSIAVSIGRSLISKVDPHLIVYEPYNGSFKMTITL